MGISLADGAQPLGAFRDTQDPHALVEASASYRTKERLEKRGHLDAMLARYTSLRQYLPAFLALPFQAAAGSETLLKAIEICRALDAGTRDPLTVDDPHDFVRADWRAHLATSGKSGTTLERGIWEISLAFTVRDALRAGSLFLTQSRNHVSFWNLIYEDQSWQQAREQAYQRLDLPTDGQTFLIKITAEFDRVVQAAERRIHHEPLRDHQGWPAQAQEARRHTGFPRPSGVTDHDQRQSAQGPYRGSVAGRG